MSSLLNNASLLLNPAGSIISYQEDKIYSVLPRNGAGDFTFSGGDGGTRVNQQGYIEVTPANILTYSNTFSNGIWEKTQSAVNTTTAVRDPFGGLNAWKYTENTTGNNYSRLRQSFLPSIAGRVFTTSFYVKAAERNQVMVYCNWASAGVWFDVESGIFLSYYQGTSTNIVGYGVENAGDGWFRVWVAASTVNTSTQYTEIFVSQAQDIYASKTVGYGVYIYGAQLVEGSSPKPYQPTTDRLNYPRINFEDGAGAMLTEMQSTNLNTYSQFITSSIYTTSNLTTVYGATTSPDGTENATQLIENTAASQRYILRSGQISSSGRWISSFFVKPAGRDWVYFEVGAGRAYFNCATGEFGSTGSFDANWTFVSVTKKQFKNGWWRISIMADWNGSGSPYYGVKIHPAFANNVFVYTGNGVSGIYVWGIQLERLASNGDGTEKPTSYIPTTSATVTRPEDLPYKSGGFITGQEVTWVASMNCDSTTPNAFGFRLFSSSPGGWLGMYRNTTAAYNDGVNGAKYPVLGGNANIGKYFKMAAKVGGGQVKYFLNGQLALTDTFPAPGSWGAWEPDSIDVNRNYRTLAFYNEALSDTQCQELTAIRSGSGGTISSYGPYTIHTFTGSATFTPSFNGEVEVLVVAGGGGGGVCYGGGGGAGGVLYASSYGVSQGTGITVTIGSGGTNKVNVNGNGGPGGNSSFGGLTAIGGGYGGGVCGNIGGNGGSGGGGSGTGGSSRAGGSGTPGQGNNGNSSIVDGGGGGGGAGTGNLSVNRQGGDGLPYSITGFSTYYGGGGSGGGRTLLAGGLGGGGKGGIALASGVADATPYTGGGGGGSIISLGTGVSGLGGAGIVIVRYLT